MFNNVHFIAPNRHFTLNPLAQFSSIINTYFKDQVCSNTIYTKLGTLLPCSDIVKYNIYNRDLHLAAYYHKNKNKQMTLSLSLSLISLISLIVTVLFIHIGLSLLYRIVFVLYMTNQT